MLSAEDKSIEQKISINIPSEESSPSKSLIQYAQYRANGGKPLFNERSIRLWNNKHNINDNHEAIPQFT